MRRLTATLVLGLVLCASSMAGDIPGHGKQDPQPSPTPIPLENNGTPATTEPTWEMTLLEIYLALYRI